MSVIKNELLFFITLRLKFGMNWETLSIGQQNRLSLVMSNLPSGFPTWTDTNRAVEKHKLARGSKFQIYEVEGYMTDSVDSTGRAIGLTPWF